MQLITITVLCLLTFVSSSPIEKRQSASVVESDISNLVSQLSSLNADVAAFNGTLLGAVDVDVAGENLASAITNATSDIESSPAFAAADAMTITNDASAFAPNVESTLSALAAKEPDFNSLGLDSSVAGQLTTLRNVSAALGAALEAKVGTANAATIASNTMSIDSVCASAIAVFS